jgi:hypothetical protein
MMVFWLFVLLAPVWTVIFVQLDTDGWPSLSDAGFPTVNAFDGMYTT